MTVDWNEVNGFAWRKEFKDLNVLLNPEEISLLDDGPNSLQETWQLGTLHAEYKRLKKLQPPMLPIV